MTLEEAKSLALKIMSKTMDSTKLGSEKRESPFSSTLHLIRSETSQIITVEFATMTLHPKTQEPLAKIYRATELDALLRANSLGGTVEDSVGVGEGTGGGGGGGDVAVST